MAQISRQRYARRAHVSLKDTTPVKPAGFAEPVEESLPEAIQRIVQTLHPQKIILFGSYVYGTPTPDSDVDLLVIMETSASPSERYLTVSRLLRPRPFPVDILVKTPSEIDIALKTGDFFVGEIVSQGRVVYEREL